MFEYNTQIPENVHKNVTRLFDLCFVSYLVININIYQQNDKQQGKKPTKACVKIAIMCLFRINGAGP